MNKKKIGRPTTNPKGASTHIRLDAECAQIVADYAAQEKVSNAEAIRRGIRKLKDDIKKK